MCFCAYVHLYQQGKGVREQVCYSLFHHDEGSKRTKAEQEEWLETFSCRRFHTDVHVQSIKMLIILLSTVLASHLKGWKMFFPPHFARKGHVITDSLASSLSKVVSVCVTGSTDAFHISCACQIQHMICPWGTLQLTEWLAKLQAQCLKLYRITKKALPSSSYHF